MSTVFSRWCGRAAGLCCLFFAGFLVGAEIESTSLTLSAAPLPVITNLFQVRQLGLQNSGISRPIRLEGQVCWVSPTQKTFAMLDASEGLILEMEWLNQPLSIGQRVRLTGAATVLKAGNIFRIGVDGLVVDDDGLHPMIERTGAVLLKAGRTPIQVEWFNGTGPFGLEVSCEGPDLPRRKINDSELSRSPGETINRVNGLDYRCFEGWWTELPDFSRLKPVKTGTIDNFNLGVRTRDEGVGLQFSGFFEVPRDGIYKFYLNSDDGSRLSIGQPNLQVEIIGQSQLPTPRAMFIGQLLDEAEDGSWSQIEGKVTKVWPAEEGLRMELSVGLARMEVEVPDKAERPEFVLMNSLVRVTGFCQAARNSDGLKVPNLLLVPSSRLIEIVAPPSAAGVTSTNPAGLPVLTTAIEVHHLKRAEAQLGYPAKVRGVITSIDDSNPGFTLQDSTGGLYMQGVYPVRVGDFVEVEGVTDPGLFAPMLNPSRVNRLGEGRLPEPIRPTWDQLMNGSLDAQYVEIEGIVTAVTGGGVQLLTHGGIIKAELQSGLNREEMNRYENTLIRIRGALLANWNPQTHQVRLGEVRIFNPNVTVENPSPADAFSAPYKTAADLLLFDAQASLFQRIRMSGQIVHAGEEVYFMMAGTNGVRFVANTPGALRAGDTVDVVGYPQLGGASPLLREAVVRKTGQAALPEARRLPPGNLASAECDSTRVRVEGVLAGVRETGTEMVLEMQDGAQSFVARMKGGHEFLHSLPIGSRLQLVGVYAVQGGNQVSDQHIASFDLLLDSPADIRVLARPPWWTLRRLLVMVGMLACILVVALLWITQLHRKVEERTVQLKEQSQKHQSIEQHRAMEQERARIAKDLHDELGSSLTEIGMLAAGPVATTDSPRHLDQIGDRARHMVVALDEIVWAMNPKHDSLESLGSYLCLYADHFLKLANITFRLTGTLDLPNQTLNPIHRHEFFLAFKEALTNVVRHSGATEVRLSIRIIGNRLRLSLADDGGGLGSGPPTAGMDGLANMRARLEKMGGRFAIASQAGRGTTLRFYLPLN
jgi:signal transduction histidine kinase